MSDLKQLAADVRDGKAGSLTALLARVEAMEPAKLNTNQRLWDLVRQQRMELHRDRLITDEEYAVLAAYGGARRLEDYDALRDLALRALLALRRAKEYPAAHHTSRCTKSTGGALCSCGYDESCRVLDPVLAALEKATAMAGGAD